MAKNTQELIHELKSRSDVAGYLQENQDELYDFSLKEYLEQLLEKKQLNKAQVIADSGLNQIYGYQIFSGRKKPSRDKILALSFGLKLDLDETQHLLTMAGVSVLYPRIQRDSIIVFAIEKKLTVIECNELLFGMNEYILE